MKITTHDEYIRIDARADTVNKDFLNSLVDFVAQIIAGYPQQGPPILLVVEGPKLELDPIDSLEVWKRAAEKGVQRAKIAYVISGRPIEPVVQFIEVYVQNRGMQMRFFSNRSAALKWLL